MRKLITLYNLIVSKILLCYYRQRKNTREALMFIPHSGVSQFDYIDLFNYRSDSAMSFAHYLLENHLCEDKEFIVFVPSIDYVEKSYERALVGFPLKKISFIPWSYIINDIHSPNYIRNLISFCKCIIRCSHVFNSITYRLEDYIKDQVVVDLNYFSAPFKNDLLPASSNHYMGLEKVGKKYTKIMLSSELSIRVMMPTMSLTREQYSDFGLCRNDYLLENDSFPKLKQQLLSSVSYKASKIILYIPTHRDYEKNMTDVARTLFGYSMDLSELDKTLREEGMIIICKVHPHQNRAAFSSQLPESIKIHQAHHEYGLCELMTVSDCLIGDYSSGYFDYLLLDKPVIFNFYDVEKYKEERGFTYNPIESIVAGDIVKTPEEFINALHNIDSNSDRWKAKRAFVRDLIFTYQDSNCCKRVYEFFFEHNVKYNN